jgi:hypothetical protein
LWNCKQRSNWPGSIKFFRERLIPLSESEIIKLAEDLENDIKQIKDEVYRITWGMRGGVSSHDLLWRLSYEDRQIMSAIMKDNIEATNKTGLNLV